LRGGQPSLPRILADAALLALLAFIATPALRPSAGERISCALPQPDL